MRKYSIGHIQSNDTTVLNDVTNIALNNNIANSKDHLTEGIVYSFKDASAQNILSPYALGKLKGYLTTDINSLDATILKQEEVLVPTLQYSYMVKNNVTGESYASFSADGIEGLYTIDDSKFTCIYPNGTSWNVSCTTSTGIMYVGSAYYNKVLKIKDGIVSEIIHDFAGNHMYIGTDDTLLISTSNASYEGIYLIKNESISKIYNTGQWTTFFEINSKYVISSNVSSTLGVIYYNGSTIKQIHTSGYGWYVCFTDHENKPYVCTNDKNYRGLYYITSLDDPKFTRLYSDYYTWSIAYTDTKINAYILQCSSGVHILYNNKLYASNYNTSGKYHIIEADRVYLYDHYLLLYDDSSNVPTLKQLAYSVTLNIAHVNNNKSVYVSATNNYSASLYYVKQGEVIQEIKQSVKYFKKFNGKLFAVCGYGKFTISLLGEDGIIDTISTSISVSDGATAYEDYDNDCIYFTGVSSNSNPGIISYYNGKFTHILTQGTQYTKSVIAYSTNSLYLLTGTTTSYAGVAYVTPTYAEYLFKAQWYTSTSQTHLTDHNNNVYLTPDYQTYGIYYVNENTYTKIRDKDTYNLTYYHNGYTYAYSKNAAALVHLNKENSKIMISTSDIWTFVEIENYLYCYSKQYFYVIHGDEATQVCKQYDDVNWKFMYNEVYGWYAYSDYALIKLSATGPVLISSTSYSMAYTFTASNGAMYFFGRGSNTTYGCSRAVDTVRTSLFTQGSYWQYLCEDTSGAVYIGSSSTSVYGGGHGIYRDYNGTCTQIKNTSSIMGPNSCYADKKGNVYYAYTVGLMYIKGDSFKWIYKGKINLNHVQETPNGLLVADTEFIGPDDKILYIKGDRVMETSINEINAYNKEANNE